MAGKTGFTWKSDTLSGPLKRFPANVEKAIVAAVEFHSTKAEEYAKRNAPWTDRSTNARDGLFTTTQHVPYKTHRIIVAHSMDYGIWLEIRNQGRYQIIIPTINDTGKNLMMMLGKMFATIGAR